MPINPNTDKNYIVWQPLIVAIAAAIGLIAGYKMNFANNDLSLIKLNNAEVPTAADGRIEEILRFVESNYVDSLDQDEMTIDAINHILRQLDPHSSYITPEELTDHNEKMEGKYKGIGIETIKLRDTFYITRLVPNGPADKIGLQVGDAILSIEDQELAGNESSFDDMRQYLNGDKKLDFLKIRFLKLDGKEEIVDTLGPRYIEIASAKKSYLVDDNTAYIKLTRFSANTYAQFMKSVEVLLSDKEKINLIIDLRDNPGGYLPQAINILCQLFDEKDKLLTYTEGLNRKKAEYRTTGKVFFNIDKVAILTNANSASGSEILAAAIQDWDRGYVIGESTYGKGLVQQIFPLTNGGALRLTIAKYYTPSGRLIQKSYNNINNDFVADTSRYETRILSRSVDGGGGVDPDYEIQDVYNEACLDYEDYVDFYLIDLMKQFKTSRIDHNQISLDAFNKFINDEFEGDSDALELTCDADIIELIEARMTRMQKGENEYQELRNQNDPYIIKALELIKNNKTTLALLSEK